MYNPETGAGWEVVRTFASSSQALQAGNEILHLLNIRSEYLVYDGYSPPGQEGVDAYRLHAHHPNTFPDHPHTIQADKDALEQVPNLVEIHRRAAKIVRGYVGSPYIHIFRQGGHTRRHRDRLEGETFVVSLLGEVECYLVDPATRESFTFTLYPGDGLHLINPRKQSLRPRHKVTNVASPMRISLVE